MRNPECLQKCRALHGYSPWYDDYYRPWNSVHENGGCHDTAPRGGGGRIYCFTTGE